MPLINRVGGGGVDVSSVTATAERVWEGYTFVDVNGEVKEGKIPAYNNKILHSINCVELSNFSKADNSDDGVVFTFKVDETQILNKGAEIDIMAYRSDWDEGYAKQTISGYTSEVESRKITIPVTHAATPRYIAITIMADKTAFSDAGTYELFSLIYDPSSDYFAWGVSRKKSDGSITTTILSENSLSVTNNGGNITITLDMATYSFAGNQYVYLVVW